MFIKAVGVNASRSKGLLLKEGFFRKALAMLLPPRVSRVYANMVGNWYVFLQWGKRADYAK